MEVVNCSTSPFWKLILVTSEQLMVYVGPSWFDHFLYLISVLLISRTLLKMVVLSFFRITSCAIMLPVTNSKNRLVVRILCVFMFGFALFYPIGRIGFYTKGPHIIINERPLTLSLKSYFQLWVILPCRSLSGDALRYHCILQKRSRLCKANSFLLLHFRSLRQAQHRMLQLLR